MGRSTAAIGHSASLYPHDRAEVRDGMDLVEDSVRDLVVAEQLAQNLDFAVADGDAAPSRASLRV